MRRTARPAQAPRVTLSIAFLLAAGDFVTPSLVGGVQGMMVGNVIADQFRGIGANWPLGAALAFTTLVTVVVIYLVVMRTIRWVVTW